MANIATGYVRLMPKPAPSDYLPVGNILNRLLSGWEGRSYHVPIFVRQDEVTFVKDIQHGGRWGVNTGELIDIWFDYESVLEAIWVREYDAGGDHDRIMWLDHIDARNRRFTRCRYGFDSMRITWKPDATPDDFGLQWAKDGSVWSLAVQGSYFAANDRCSLGLDRDPEHPPMQTPTTLTGGRGIEDKYVWTLDEFSPLPTDLVSHVKDSASTVEFFWKGRLVRLQKRQSTVRYSLETTPGWHEYCLDDWDNCVDENWLAFNELSGQNTAHPPTHDDGQP